MLGEVVRHLELELDGYVRCRVRVDAPSVYDMNSADGADTGADACERSYSTFASRREAVERDPGGRSKRQVPVYARRSRRPRRYLSWWFVAHREGCATGTQHDNIRFHPRGHEMRCRSFVDMLFNAGTIIRLRCPHPEEYKAGRTSQTFVQLRI